MAKLSILDHTGLNNFLENLKKTFSKIGHTHTISDITDYSVDASLSSTSTKPVQNKVVKSALDAKVSTTRTINGKPLTDNISLTASDIGADSSGAANNAVSAHNTSGAAHDDIRNLINDLDTGKVDKVSGKVLSSNDYTTTEKNKLSGIASGAEVNQNAFSNVKVGTVTVAADSKTDTVELVAGTNVTLTPDATNDKITIAAKDTTYAAAGSTLGLIKTGGDLTITNGVAQVNDDSHNHVISNVDGLQSSLDSKVPTTRTVNGKSLSANISLTASDVGADASGSADSALGQAKSYTDSKIDAIMGEGASETLDTIGEISDAIIANQDMLTTLNNAVGNKANKSDLTSHTGNTTVHITSAERIAWNNKVDKETGKGLSTNDYTTAEKSKLSGIASGAQVNQNAFSNIVVGSTTIAADSTTDTLTLIGSNVTLTPDATNDKLTIGITKDNVTAALGYVPPTVNTTYGVATSSAPGLVKSGTDITVDSSGNVSVNDDSHNHVISNVDGLQAALDARAVIKTLTSENLNSVLTPGFYCAGGSNTVTNKPSGVDYFGLEVIHNASGVYYTQILYVGSTSYRRSCTNSTWTSWVKDVLTDTNTHYTTKIYAGASGTAANAAATSPYVKIADDSTYRNQIRLIGSGSVTVSSDANGNITFAGTDTNDKVTNTLATTTKAYITGTTSATTNTGTQVFDTGVYLDTTAGQLVATTFKGNLSGTATKATSADSATSATSATKLATARTIQTNLASTSAASFNGTGNVTPGVTGVLQPTNGGTGKSSLLDSANDLLNALTTGSSTPTDSDYYICQYAGGGTTTTTYHRRPMSSMWNWIKAKTDKLYLSLSGGTVTGVTSFTNTTASTSKTTGAVKVSGGLGVAGQVSANAIMIGDGCTLAYDSTNKCVNFTFN